MESSRFDELTKSLATATSRRQALKTLAVTTFGGILALSGLGNAFAKTCPPGKKLCAGKCVDTKTDPHNCGVCGTVCKSGLCVNGLCCPPGAIKCGNSCCSFTCQNGKCVPPCTANGGKCSGNSDCCSGNCSNGVCCGSGKVGLCNGSCATPCTSSADCPGCVSGCQTDVSGAHYCAGQAVTDCGTGNDCNCPTGSFCNAGICVATC